MTGGSPVGTLLLDSTVWPGMPGSASEPGPDEARRWATEELAGGAYQKSSVERFMEWVLEWLADLTMPGADGGGAAPMPVALAIVGALVAAALIVLIFRFRRGRPTPSRSLPVAAADPLFAGGRLPARDHRRLAQAAAADGDASTAAIEGYRALTARMLERHLLDDLPERTAGEFGAASARIFPTHALEIHRAAALFDQTLYGGLTPRLDDARDILQLDDVLAEATAQPDPAAALPRALAAPR